MSAVDINITLNPTSISATIGEMITLKCKADISRPSNTSLSWSGPNSNYSILFQNVQYINDTLTAITKESYHWKKIFCIVSANGLTRNTSVALLVTSM